MEILTRAALAALLLGAAGCDPRRDPTPLALGGERVVVHSVLRAGADTVAVLVRRVRPPRHEDDSTASVALSGAEVRLRRGDAEVALAEGGRGCPDREGGAEAGRSGCYAAVLPGGVRAGEPHALRITLPGGGRVTGVAVPPAPPRLLRPAEGERVPVASGASAAEPLSRLHLRWAADPAAAGTAVALRPGEAFARGRRVEGVRCAVDAYTALGPAELVRELRGVDSLSLVLGYVGCEGQPGQPPFRPDSLRVELVVAAYDTAYTRYARLFVRESARAESASAGLSGALGVFGGMAVATRSFTLVLAPSPAAGATRH